MESQHIIRYEKFQKDYSYYLKAKSKIVSRDVKEYYRLTNSEKQHYEYLVQDCLQKGYDYYCQQFPLEN